MNARIKLGSKIVFRDNGPTYRVKDMEICVFDSGSVFTYVILEKEDGTAVEYEAHDLTRAYKKGYFEVVNAN